MKKGVIVILAAAFMFLPGCIANNAAVSQGKTAYVVKGHLFGTKMYHCDASSGSPVCTAVAEQTLEGGN